MARIDELLETYGDKLVFVERKKDGFKSINELVDIIEESLEKLTLPHLNSLIGEPLHSQKSRDTDTADIKLYKVIDNEKSRVYYDYLMKMNKLKRNKPIYFWDEAIYFVVKEDRDIVSLGNLPLSYDYQVNQGITEKDYKEKSDDLLLYLEVFDMYLE